MSTSPDPSDERPATCDEQGMGAWWHGVRQKEKEGKTMQKTEWQNRGITTDLAMEAHELAGGQVDRPIPGVKVDQRQEEGNTVTRITVDNEEAGKALGKLPGSYVTIQAPDLLSQNRDKVEAVSKILATEIEGFMGRLNLKEDDTCLVAGLGNWSSTPDSIGPKVVEAILVTRHLWSFSPPEKGEGSARSAPSPPACWVSPAWRQARSSWPSCSGLSPLLSWPSMPWPPGVSKRLGTTIQLSDTGIHPGSGLGNNRVGITPGFLGVPVISVGIPTVVYAATIVLDALDKLSSARRGLVAPGVADQKDTIRQIISPEMGDLVVTPKEVDILVEEVAKVVAGSLNIALHPGVGPDEVFRYLQ